MLHPKTLVQETLGTAVGLEQKDRMASGKYGHSCRCTCCQLTFEVRCPKASVDISWEQGECCRHLRRVPTGLSGFRPRETEREGEGRERKGKVGRGGREGWRVRERWREGERDGGRIGPREEGRGKWRYTWRDSCLDFQWVSSSSKTQRALPLYIFPVFMVTRPSPSWANLREFLFFAPERLQTDSLWNCSVSSTISLWRDEKHLNAKRSACLDSTPGSALYQLAGSVQIVQAPPFVKRGVNAISFTE